MFSFKTLTVTIMVLVLGVVSFYLFSEINKKETIAVIPVTNVSVNSCIPESYGTEAEYNENNLYECLYEGIVSSADAGPEVFASNTALLENYASKDSVFANICHLASHDAGSAYAKQTNPVTALTLTTDFCFSGFVHGVFDFIGSYEKAPTLWNSSAVACENLSEKRPMACADGLGHASWDFFKNPEDAFNNCEVFTNTSKVTECAEGVVMQMFAPAVVKPTSVIVPRPNDLSNVCDSATSTFAVKGCFLGLGWLLGNDVATTSAPYLGQVNYPENQYSALQEIFTKNSNICLSLTNGSSDCLARFYTSIPFPLWEETSVRSLLCDSLPLSREACRATADSMAGSSR